MAAMIYVQQVVEKYRPKIIVHGSDFLLPLRDAVSLVIDLGGLGIRMLGFDGWRYVNEDSNKLVQALDIGFDVEDHMPYLDIKGFDSAEIISFHLRLLKPQDVDLISIDIDDLDITNLFLRSNTDERRGTTTTH